MKEVRTETRTRLGPGTANDMSKSDVMEEREELERQFFDCLKQRLVRYEGLKALALLVGERIAARDADGANALLLKQQEYISEIRAFEEKEALLRKRLQARFGLLAEQSLEQYLLQSTGAVPTAPETSSVRSDLARNPSKDEAARSRENFRERLAEANGQIASVLESIIKITNENEANLRAGLAQVKEQLLDLQKAKAAQRAYRGSGMGGRPESRFVDKRR